MQEKIHDQEFSLVQSMLSSPNDTTEMQQVIDAFNKVFDHLDDLQIASRGELLEEPKLSL